MQQSKQSSCLPGPPPALPGPSQTQHTQDKLIVTACPAPSSFLTYLNNWLIFMKLLKLNISEAEPSQKLISSEVLFLAHK